MARGDLVRSEYAPDYARHPAANVEAVMRYESLMEGGMDETVRLARDGGRSRYTTRTREKIAVDEMKRLLIEGWDLGDARLGAYF